MDLASLDSGQLDLKVLDSSGLDSALARDHSISSTRATSEFFAHLEQNLAREQEIAPFDLLGRSLSYNPYPPRFKEMFPGLDSTSVNMPAVMVRGFGFEALEGIVAKQPALIVLDLARDELARPSGEGLECVGYLRHYTNALIVLRDYFINPYQMLQALVYGADAIMLNHLPKNAKALLDFAFRLNLMSFTLIESPKDIKRAIMARSEGLAVVESIYDEVATLIPRQKCLAKLVLESREADSSALDSGALDSAMPGSKSRSSREPDFTCVSM